MRYTVVWTKRATMGLAELWLAADDKASVTAATNLIDRHLAEQPLDQRHEVVRGFGTAVRVPLGVDFVVDVRDGLVTITGVWAVLEDAE
jgi:hypothetical protein